MGESVYCGCGAQWHGVYASSDAIDYHRRRWPTKDGGCESLTHAAFVAAGHRCACDDCKMLRRAPRPRRQRPPMDVQEEAYSVVRRGCGFARCGYLTRGQYDALVDEVALLIARLRVERQSVGAVDPVGEQVTG